MNSPMIPALAIQNTGPAPRTFLNVETSLTGRRWVERLTFEGAATALAIAQRYQVPDIVARVLAGRGVAADDAPAFLTPTLKALMPDPSVLTDMDKAAARIADAVVAARGSRSSATTTSTARLRRRCSPGSCGTRGSTRASISPTACSKAMDQMSRR